MLTTLNQRLLQCSRLFSQHAWLALLTLLLLLGSMLGLWYAHPTTASMTISTRGSVTTGQCSHASLALQPQTTVQQLSRLLTSEDALVIYGPDEFSEYQIRFAQSPDASAIARLQARAEVAGVIVHPSCL